MYPLSFEMLTILGAITPAGLLLAFVLKSVFPGLRLKPSMGNIYSTAMALTPLFYLTGLFAPAPNVLLALSFLSLFFIAMISGYEVYSSEMIDRTEKILFTVCAVFVGYLVILYYFLGRRKQMRNAAM